MPRKLEDVLRRRRLHKRSIERLIVCHDELYQLREYTRAVGYAVTSTELPEEAHCICLLTDRLFDSLNDLQAEIGLLIKMEMDR